MTDEILLEHKDHIIKHTIDGEDGFNEYLATTHVNIITDDLIFLYSLMDDYIAFYYLEPFNRKGSVELSKLGVGLFDVYTTKYNMPIMYTGKRNVLGNNSIEIEPDVYQFIPKEFHIK